MVKYNSRFSRRATTKTCSMLLSEVKLFSSKEITNFFPQPKKFSSSDIWNWGGVDLIYPSSFRSRVFKAVYELLQKSKSYKTFDFFNYKHIEWIKCLIFFVHKKQVLSSIIYLNFHGYANRISYLFHHFVICVELLY